MAQHDHDEPFGVDDRSREREPSPLDGLDNGSASASADEDPAADHPFPRNPWSSIPSPFPEPGPPPSYAQDAAAASPYPPAYQPPVPPDVPQAPRSFLPPQAEEPGPQAGPDRAATSADPEVPPPAEHPAGARRDDAGSGGVDPFPPTPPPPPGAGSPFGPPSGSAQYASGTGTSPQAEQGYGDYASFDRFEGPYAGPYNPHGGDYGASGPGSGPQQAPPEAAPLPPLSPEGHDAGSPAVHETADSLRPETLLRGRRHAPAAGWRRVVYKATGGLVHPGESPAELHRRELLARARTPVAGGHHRVAVMSLKGGVGKTTTTVGLGATLASVRGDRIIAVDANPDRGTLSDKVRLETAATVRDLLNERHQVQRYADVRAFTSQAPSRLEVLASDRDPAVSEAFSEHDYRAVAEVLEHFYSICLTDCGTGLLHSAMAGVLGLAHQIVLVSSPSVDGARSASATLDWLEAHDHGDLVRNAVVVLSMVRSRSKSTVDLARLEHHFASRCRAVVRIPYDPHLEEGAEIDLERLNQATRDAYLQLAATVGDGFAWR